MQFIVDSQNHFGGPYCYVEADTPEQALAKAGEPCIEERDKFAPFAACQLRPELGETLPGDEMTGEWHSA
jgi:hypothetical protein